MRVHVDVTHPAHAHLFRPAVETLTERGHEVAVTSRDKEVTTDLLDAAGIDHCVLSTMRDSTLALGPEWALRSLRTLQFVRAFQPDVVLTQLNPASITAAAASDAACIVFHDSEIAGGLARALAPLADRICSPQGVQHDFGDHHEHYPGFHELAYLHPNRFEPDLELLRDYGVDPEEPYAVLRTTSLGAYHDVGAQGLSERQARRLARELSEYGDVYVSSEGEPPAALPAEATPVPAEAMHDLLAAASVFVGDSDTMAIEAGVLGTPSVRVDAYGEGTLGCFDELDEYGLVTSTTDGDEAVDRAIELAADPDAGERWQRRREALLADKVDVTEYVLEVVREEAGETVRRPARIGSGTPTRESVGAAGGDSHAERQIDQRTGGERAGVGSTATDGGGARTADGSGSRVRAEELATNVFGGARGAAGSRSGDATEGSQ